MTTDCPPDMLNPSSVGGVFALGEPSPGVVEGYWRPWCPNYDEPISPTYTGTVDEDLHWQAQLVECPSLDHCLTIIVSGTGYPGVVKNGKVQHSSHGEIQFVWLRGCSAVFDGVWRAPNYNIDPHELNDECP